MMDFDALHGGGGADLGANGPRLANAPWQLDEPQPLVVELADQFIGPVLDGGCWVGDNALMLAARGFDVTAVDIAASAVEQARAKAAARGLDVDFRVADATELVGIRTGFNTILDSAMMHCLFDADRRAWLTAAHRVAAPGARLHVLCFPDFVAGAFPMPGDLAEAGLRRDIEVHWEITGWEVRRYTTNMDPAALRDLVPDASMELAVDDGRGRSMLPIWHIAATRR